MKQTLTFLVAAILIAATFFILGKRNAATNERLPEPTSSRTQTVTEKPQLAVPPAPADPAPTELAVATPTRSSNPLINELSMPKLAPYSTDDQNFERLKEDQITELHSLASEKTEAAMLYLLSESQSSNSEIRETALFSLQHARQREAIPYLEALMEETKDTGLLKEYSETIKFLSMETFSEYRARKKAQKQAQLNQ